MTWDYKSTAMLLEGTSQDISDLGLHEYSHVTRGTPQEVPGISQDISDQGVYHAMVGGLFEEVRNFSHLGLQNVAMLP